MGGIADFYDGRAGAENLIKEANNDAGFALLSSDAAGGRL